MSEAKLQEMLEEHARRRADYDRADKERREATDHLAELERQMKKIRDAEQKRQREEYEKTPEYLNDKREGEALQLAKWKETMRDRFKGTLNLFDFVMEEMAGTRSETEKHTLAIMLAVRVASENIMDNMPEFECRAD